MQQKAGQMVPRVGVATVTPSP